MALTHTPLRLALRILVIGFSVTLLAGYVAFSQFRHSRQAAGSSKSTRILEDLRQIDASIDQRAVQRQETTDNVTFPGSKSGGVFRDVRISGISSENRETEQVQETAAPQLSISLIDRLLSRSSELLDEESFPGTKSGPVVTPRSVELQLGSANSLDRIRLRMPAQADRPNTVIEQATTAAPGSKSLAPVFTRDDLKQAPWSKQEANSK